MWFHNFFLRFHICRFSFVCVCAKINSNPFSMKFFAYVFGVFPSVAGECEGCNIQRCLFCLWVCPPPARDKRRNCHVLQRWPDVWPMLCYPLSGVLSTLTPLLRLQRRLPVSPWQLLWLWPGGTAAPSAGFWGWGCCHLCKSTSDTTEMVLRIRSHQQGWNHQRTGGEKQQTWDPF